MKTKLFKTFSLLLSITLLVVMSSFIASASDLTGLEAVDASVELDGTKDVTVTVGLVCTKDLTVYGIEGVWKEDSDYLSLNALGSDKLSFNVSEGNYADLGTGKVLWTDAAFEGKGVMASGQKILTATYTVKQNTPAGEYKVRFVRKVFTGSDGNPDEAEVVYEATIKVIHKCIGVKQDGQAPTCTVAGWLDYYKCNTCNKLYSDADCQNEINLTTWKNGDGKIPATNHDWTTIDPTYTNNGDNHTVKYVCGKDAKHTKEEIEEHDFSKGDCPCGAVGLTVVKKGNTISYTVSGRVVTVTCASACKVGYWDAVNGKYVAISAVANPNGSYSFTVPNGYNEVLIVVKGDVSGNGKVDNPDVTQAKAIFQGRRTPTAEQLFAGDVTGDYAVKNPDVTQIKAVFQGLREFTW